MKSIKLTVISMNLLPDGGAAIITKQSNDNPSPNGVHKVNAGQLARIAVRALGVNSPVGLKHLVDLGGCTLSIDSSICKPGDTWENKKTGETGIYEGAKNADGSIKGDGSWTKYSNHEINLSFAGKMKLVELSLQGKFDVQETYQAPVVAVAKPEFGIKADAVAETVAETEDPKV